MKLPGKSRSVLLAAWVTKPCLGCNLPMTVPDDSWHLCQDCRRESYDRLAQQLDPTFVPSPDSDVLVLLRPLAIIERYQGWWPGRREGGE